MPTYEYGCPSCGARHEKIQTIGEYSRNPDVPVCCGNPTERRLSVVPGLAVSNALHSNRHYEGLRAPDGTDISSRTKHRQYMKQHGLALTDDFKGQWSKQKEEREKLRTGTFQDKELRQSIEKDVYKVLK